MIELTDEQLQAIEGQADGPLQALNPHTKEVFFLIRPEVYELVRRVIDGPNRRGWDDPTLDIYEQCRKRP